MNQKIAGIASYTTSLSSFLRDPDIDSSLNSSFGEIGAWQRVSSYQQWIDQSMRAMYADAPTAPSEVKRYEFALTEIGNHVIHRTLCLVDMNRYL